MSSTHSIPLASIVHFGKFYLPEVGGIEAVTASVAEGAVKAGHAVSVVCFEGEQPAAARETINSVEVLRAKQSLNVASQPLSMDYIRLALRASSAATVVHLHAPNLLAALCSLWLPPQTRLLVHWHSDIRNKGLLGRMIRPLERRYLQRADVIVVTSEVYGRTSEALQPFQKKLRVVPIGVPDPGAIAAAEGAEASRIDTWESRLQNRRVILSVGRLVSFKGFGVLVDAAKSLADDVAVVIVGDGPARVGLQARIDAAGLEGKVFLTGSLPGRQTGGTLHRLFQRADLYCLPSIDRSESFGVVLIEAMAYGTPCLVSDISGSGVTWVCEAGVSGSTFPVEDAAALAREAMRLLNDPFELQRLGEGARARFLALFTEEVATRRMLDVYDDLR